MDRHIGFGPPLGLDRVAGTVPTETGKEVEVSESSPDKEKGIPHKIFFDIEFNAPIARQFASRLGAQ